MAFAGGAAGVDVEQLGSGVAHLLGGLALGFFPLAAAQLVQRGLVGAHAGVASDQLQLAHRHIQRGFVGVFEVQKLLQCGRAVGVLLAQVHVDQAPVAADAVRAVHDWIAHIQLGEVLDQGLHVADLLLLFAAAGGGSGGKEFGLGDEVDAFFKPVKAAGQRGGRHADFFLAGEEFFEAVEDRRREAAGAHKVQQAFTAAVALGQDQQAVRAAAQVGPQARERVVRAAHHGEFGQAVKLGVFGLSGGHTHHRSG